MYQYVVGHHVCIHVAAVLFWQIVHTRTNMYIYFIHVLMHTHTTYTTHTHTRPTHTHAPHTHAPHTHTHTHTHTLNLTPHTRYQMLLKPKPSWPRWWALFSQSLQVQYSGMQATLASKICIFVCAYTLRLHNYSKSKKRHAGELKSMSLITQNPS